MCLLNFDFPKADLDWWNGEVTLSWMFLSIRFEFWIAYVTLGLFYVMFRFFLEV